MCAAEQTNYDDLQMLVEHGRKLHSQAIFNAIVWLGTKIRLTGDGIAEKPVIEQKAGSLDGIDGVLESPLHAK